MRLCHLPNTWVNLVTDAQLLFISSIDSWNLIYQSHIPVMGDIASTAFSLE